MTLADELAKIKTVFIDTAPIIYYIEAHPHFGPLVKVIVDSLQSGNINAFSSVITLMEVLPKPIESGNDSLAKQFSEFLKAGKNLTLLEISSDIAELAGTLRGQYPSLRAMDAIQIAVSLIAKTDVFITNDAKIKQVRGLRVIVLKDYL